MRVHIGLPCYGALVSSYTLRSIVDLSHALRDKGIDHTIDMVIHESLVQRARNALVADFLEDPKATHHLWIDADIRFRAQDAMALLEADRDVVCGAYPAKGISQEELVFAAKNDHPDPLKYATRMVVNALQPEDGATSRQFDVDNGCIPIMEAATGFLCIKRGVYERMIEAYPEVAYKSDAPRDRGRQMYALFDCAIRDDRYLSEDYLFSRRWTDLGGTVWLYLPAELGHVGQHIYTGDIYKVFNPVVPPEAA